MDRAKHDNNALRLLTQVSAIKSPVRFCASGAANRRLPTGAAAYGIPRNSHTSGWILLRWPMICPFGVVTTQSVAEAPCTPSARAATSRTVVPKGAQDEKPPIILVFIGNNCRHSAPAVVCSAPIDTLSYINQKQKGRNRARIGKKPQRGSSGLFQNRRNHLLKGIQSKISHFPTPWFVESVGYHSPLYSILECGQCGQWTCWDQSDGGPRRGLRMLIPLLAR